MINKSRVLVEILKNKKKDVTFLKLKESKYCESKK
tara:strand:+ start:165 stop:269 length:105 start_codon:yes stop_codon:yes gene_type:complete